MAKPKSMIAALLISVSLSSFVPGIATSPVGAAPNAGAAGTIRQAVLTRRITPLTHAAVEATDKFPAKGSLWAVITLVNAPHDTRLHAVLATVNVGKAAPPNSKVGEDNGTYDGSQNVGFNWEYNGLPLGTYKVDVYLNDKLDRTLNFTVADQVPPDAPPKPAAIGRCPKPATPRETPPGFALGVTLAQGRDGAGNPVNPGRIFRPDLPAFYAVLNTMNAPPNTRLGAKWFAADVGGLEPCNVQFSTLFEVTVSGSGQPWFSKTPGVKDVKWPEGLYRLEIDVNGAPALNTDFAVCDGPCKFQAPLAATLR